jgi:YidC/Oxa1 family membrane protein insertase
LACAEEDCPLSSLESGRLRSRTLSRADHRGFAASNEEVSPVWAAVKDFILQCLNFLYNIVGNYGLAIVLLTVVMRLILLPLTAKRTKSMYEMQKIQPKIKELQKKYKDDKQKLQEETLKFYQDNKVNPFGGCLPLILQMPLFWALFQVLGGTAQKPGELMRHFIANPSISKSFYFIIPDITKSPAAIWGAQHNVLVALPYVIMALLFALSVWLPQQLMPGEKSQKMMGLYMSVMMLWFGWISPAGVLIYWVTSSIWQIVQQQIQMKSYSRAKPQGA